MIKKLILILFISAICYGQAIYSPKQISLFTVDDTVLAASTMTSKACDVSNWLGAAMLCVKHDSVGAAGDTLTGATGDTLNIYAKIRCRNDNSDYGDLDWGVVSDSLTTATADSMFIEYIDSASVQNKTIYIPLSDKDWWNWVEEIEFIFDYIGDADSLLLYRTILKGQ